MPNRSKPKAKARSFQNNDPHRPTLFTRVFPILIIIFALVTYFLTLPDEPTVASNSPAENSEKTFSRKYKISVIVFYLHGFEFFIIYKANRNL